MKQGIAILTVSAMVLIGAANVPAETYTEFEGVGAATNNWLASAEVIPISAFTVPVPATVFDPPGWPTATILGTGSISGDGVPAQQFTASDVDFFCFETEGGRAMFDIDNEQFTFDAKLALFNSQAILIGYSDDEYTDPGSHDDAMGVSFDPFIGEFNLQPGVYYIAVSAHPNDPATYGQASGWFDLWMPDGRTAGRGVIGAPAGDGFTMGNDGVDGGVPYTLHVSLEAPVVPEPSMLMMLSAGGLALAVGVWQRRRKS